MAVNDVAYPNVTVNAGGEESDNNTLQKIADLEGYSVFSLLKINPNIEDKDAVIPAGTKILCAVGSITDVADDFRVATITVGEKTNGLFPIIYTDNKGNEKEVAKVKPNTNDNTKPDINLETIIKNKGSSEGQWDLKLNIDLETIKKLNPAKGQTKLLSVGEIVLMEVCVPGTSTQAKISTYGIRVNSTRTCYIKWEWDHAANSTVGMEVMWKWISSDGEEWMGSKTDVSDLETFEAIYSPDESAIEVWVFIRPKEKTSSFSSSSATTSTKYSWSNKATIRFHDDWAVITPSSAPQVEIKNYKLTATYESLPVNIGNGMTDGNSEDNRAVTHVEFEVVQDGNTLLYNSSRLKVADLTGYVQYSCNISAGHRYSVRARCCKVISENLIYYSGWTEYAGPFDSLPVAPIMHDCSVLSYNTVQFNWSKVINAESYVIQYLKKDETIYNNYSSVSDYFNNNENNAEEISVDATKVSENNSILQITRSVEDGHYFVRVKSVNKTAESDWSNIIELILGELPESPTTWSSSTIVTIGEPLTLYWIHNSEDNSEESKAEIELIINGVRQQPIYVDRPIDEEQRKETSHYSINTDSYPNGCKIEWRVRTAGVYRVNGSLAYGDWSLVRTIDLYAPVVPVISLLNYNKEPITEKLTTLPFYVNVNIGKLPNQEPTGYVISVIAQNGYNTVDEMGNTKAVTQFSNVFSKYYPATEDNKDKLEVQISAKDLTLENNQSYVVTCTASMSSGLAAEASTKPFTVGWIAQGYEPNAEIGVDINTLTVRIRPFAEGAGDTVSLFVYRREFDGTFTEIVSNEEDPDSGLPNTDATWITDPHPALDYARYRVVSRSKATGLINYFDVPSYPIKEKSVVIQWDEKWQSFEALDSDTAMDNAENSYTGSILKLPYNIDVSNSHAPDVSLVRYTGRSRPVSYYGTQRGETATWNMEIPKSDKETLYALRRLAVYMGDVYVREPSGSGYWASITVSFSQKHRGLTIPITINITPVEGGM